MTSRVSTERSPQPELQRHDQSIAASSGLEPEHPGAKIRWATNYPTGQRLRWLTRQDSNLNQLIQNQPCYRLHHGPIGTCGGIRTPCAQGHLLYGQPRQALFASHAWHHRLPEQDSNLQSRINNPLVYRLTDRGIEAPEHVAMPGLEGFANHAHTSFGRSPITLEAIAWLACSHQVEPGVATATAAG